MSPRRNMAEARRKARAAAERCADPRFPHFLCACSGRYGGREHPDAFVELAARAIFHGWNDQPLFRAPARRED